MLLLRLPFNAVNEYLAECCSFNISFTTALALGIFRLAVHQYQ